MPHLLLSSFSLFCLPFLVSPFLVDDINPSKPNIILIVGDDLGWADVSWHNSLMPTPNLDRLAQGGMKLNQVRVNGRFFFINIFIFNTYMSMVGVNS